MEKPISLHVEFKLDLDKVTMRTVYILQLITVAKFVREHLGALMLIDRHMNSEGSEQYNQKSLERRVIAVKPQLIANYATGVQRIKSKDFGKSSLIVINQTDDWRRNNRKINVFIVAEKQ